MISVEPPQCHLPVRDVARELHNSLLGRGFQYLPEKICSATLFSATCCTNISPPGRDYFSQTPAHLQHGDHEMSQSAKENIMVLLVVFLVLTGGSIADALASLFF